jgi:hypothetical protein
MVRKNNFSVITHRYVAKAMKANCAEVAIPALKLRQTSLAT